ncbi:MAG TPA: hypothetical protein VGI20_10125 [Rhizomicrobium sp.]|jgi:hypothetical protein
MRAAVTFAAICFLFAFPAAAQNSLQSCPHPTTTTRPAPTPQLLAARRTAHQACAADQATYCGGVAPGCGRPMRCLRSHGDQLSSACMTALENLHVAAHAATQ